MRRPYRMRCPYWHLDRYNHHATGEDPQARAMAQMLQADAATRPRRLPQG